MPVPFLHGPSDPSRPHLTPTLRTAGACGGETACSTCHCIIDGGSGPGSMWSKLPAMEEAEEDMLDLAVGLTATSRLGCQIMAAPELEGLTIVLPKEVHNLLGGEDGGAKR